MTPSLQEQLSAYIDNALSPEERAEIERALRGDPTLQRELDRLLELSRWLKSTPAAVPPERFYNRILEKTDSRPNPWIRWTGPLVAVAATTLLMVHVSRDLRNDIPSFSKRITFPEAKNQIRSIEAVPLLPPGNYKQEQGPNQNGPSIADGDRGRSSYNNDVVMDSVTAARPADKSISAGLGSTRDVLRQDTRGKNEKKPSAPPPPNNLGQEFRKEANPALPSSMGASSHFYEGQDAEHTTTAKKAFPFDEKTREDIPKERGTLSPERASVIGSKAKGYLLSEPDASDRNKQALLSKRRSIAGSKIDHLKEEVQSVVPSSLTESIDSKPEPGTPAKTGTSGTVDGEWVGHFSGIETPRTVVIRTPEEWASLWTEHQSHNVPPALAPDVDFNKSMVIGVFAGNKPSGGFGVKISSVLTEESEMVIRYKETAPTSSSSSAFSAVITQPYHLKIVPRSSTPIRFVSDTQHP